MFADPQSVTVGGSAKSLPATARNQNSSVYTTDVGDYKLTVSHTYGRRNRFQIRVDTEKTAPDPLAVANNLVYSQSVYIVIDKPVNGYTNVEAKDLALALTAWATSANLLKVLGGET